MQRTPVSLFMDLILFDQSLLEYENQLDLLYEEMGAIDTKRNKYHLQIAQKQQELATVKQYIKACEDELNDAIENEKKLTATHKDVHDKREYAAFKKELDHSHLTQQALEKKLLAAFAQAEILEKECRQVVQQGLQDAHTFDQLLQACKEKITALEDTFEQAKNQRSAFQNQIPVEWYMQYERMRQEVVNPLAFLIDDSCSSCFQILTPAQMIQITKGPLTCKGCYRFLCIRPQEA